MGSKVEGAFLTYGDTALGFGPAGRAKPPVGPGGENNDAKYDEAHEPDHEDDGRAKAGADIASSVTGVLVQ